MNAQVFGISDSRPTCRPCRILNSPSWLGYQDGSCCWRIYPCRWVVKQCMQTPLRHYVLDKHLDIGSVSRKEALPRLCRPTLVRDQVFVNDAGPSSGAISEL
ncbi:hypothetical protein VFPPC_18166 [Pochonia chlamydosporia 170]|uniref:Uncharacterized protein n=1 Tax=Pochonia chlamydosporia 170 TaxID=1380566 RepID=A0A219AS84_METCM|nr:hypothetical protein VFPPC_18166 [Pochonia chlamydosporia 170]OWT43631.1 hypothetical protein VFPPC_18166 [Pochonia chlamydosporia 170]